MKKKLLTGVLVDVVKQTAEKLTIEHTLDNLYKILNCDSIESPVRYINGLKVLVVCDESGLLKKNQIPGMISYNLKKNEVTEYLVGNLFICKFNGVDDYESLTNDEIGLVLNSYGEILFSNGFKCKALLSLN